MFLNAYLRISQVEAFKQSGDVERLSLVRTPPVAISLRRSAVLLRVEFTSLADDAKSCSLRRGR